MRVLVCRLSVVVPLLLLSSCDVTPSTEYMSGVVEGFRNNTDDYATLQHMLLEDQIARLSLHHAYSWEINSYYSTCYCLNSREDQFVRQWHDQDGNVVTFSRVLAAAKTTEQRISRYKELMDKLSIKLLTRVGADFTFCLRSREFGSHYIVEIINTSRFITAGTTISSVREMNHDGTHYYLPFGNHWYLHCKTYTGFPGDD